MHTIETLEGKNLDEAADVMAKQLKFLCTEMRRLESNDTCPDDPRQLLDNVDKVKSNVRFFLNYSKLRLNEAQSRLKVKLMSAGQFT